MLAVCGLCVCVGCSVFCGSVVCGSVENGSPLTVRTQYTSPYLRYCVNRHFSNYQRQQRTTNVGTTPQYCRFPSDSLARPPLAHSPLSLTVTPHKLPTAAGGRTHTVAHSDGGTEGRTVTHSLPLCVRDSAYSLL